MQATATLTHKLNGGLVDTDHYRNVEAEVESTLFRRMIMVSIPLHAKLVNKSRKFGNRIKYTDEDILRIAQNRTRFHAAEANGIFARLSCWWQRVCGYKTHSESFRVTGYELKVLQSLAQLEDGYAIRVTHEYEVEPRYYKVLVDLAASRSVGG